MSHPARGIPRQLRAIAVLGALLIGFGFALACCPSNRDGMAGRLAATKEETESAARSAALAIDLWDRRRSTRQLTCVQLADARDEVAKAYQGVVELTAQNPVDLERQQLLITAMTSIIDHLNTANAAVRELPGQPEAHDVGRLLSAAAAELGERYR